MKSYNMIKMRSLPVYLLLGKALSSCTHGEEFLMRISNRRLRWKNQHAQGWIKLQLFGVCTFYFIESSVFLLFSSFILSNLVPYQLCRKSCESCKLIKAAVNKSYRE